MPDWTQEVSIFGACFLLFTFPWLSLSLSPSLATWNEFSNSCRVVSAQVEAGNSSLPVTTAAFSCVCAGHHFPAVRASLDYVYLHPLSMSSDD